MSTIKRGRAFGLTGIRETSKRTRCVEQITMFKTQDLTQSFLHFIASWHLNLSTITIVAYADNTPSKRGNRVIFSRSPRSMSIFICTYTYWVTATSHLFETPWNRWIWVSAAMHISSLHYQLAYHSLKTLNDKVHYERRKRQLTFLHSVPVLSKLDRLVSGEIFILVRERIIILNARRGRVCLRFLHI